MWVIDNWPWVRNSTLFAVGILLIIHEAVLRSGEPRPELLILYGGMIGLPAFLTESKPPAETGEKRS